MKGKNEGERERDREREGLKGESGSCCR